MTTGRLVPLSVRQVQVPGFAGTHGGNLRRVGFSANFCSSGQWSWKIFGTLSTLLYCPLVSSDLDMDETLWVHYGSGLSNNKLLDVPGTQVLRSFYVLRSIVPRTEIFVKRSKDNETSCEGV